MNNQDQAEFSYLLYEGDIDCTFVANYGGLLDTYSYDYTIFVPAVQQHLTGCENLDDFDGIHQLDCGEYVGVGRTLKEAWDSFCRVVEIDQIEELIDKVRDEQ